MALKSVLTALSMIYPQGDTKPRKRAIRAVTGAFYLIGVPDD
jgi:hypothetical protein